MSTPSKSASFLPVKPGTNTYDIGGVVAFLASNDARWITGDTIHADGGSKL
jgi:enoyl-[acyl-carrier-protein] reductase (NADH)